MRSIYLDVFARGAYGPLKRAYLVRRCLQAAAVYSEGLPFSPGPSYLHKRRQSRNGQRPYKQRQQHFTLRYWKTIGCFAAGWAGASIERQKRRRPTLVRHSTAVISLHPYISLNKLTRSRQITLLNISDNTFYIRHLLNNRNYLFYTNDTGV